MHHHAVSGSIVQLDSGAYYKIDNVNALPAFFVNIATSSDIWMFLSSNGALTAGRQNADSALFPYETDDRLHLATATGPKTIVRLPDGRIWEPFDIGRDNPFDIRRNIYKRLTGDAVIFEETNETLELCFTYRWETGENYGIVRTAALRNTGTETITAAVLDGVQNIIPYGISQGLADSSSCLTDAYKACERPGDNGLAVYSLTSTIMDTPEPVEILHANVVWSVPEASAYLLSDKQVNTFCTGEDITDERRSVGRKCAYLAHRDITLSPGGEESWLLVMDARLSQRALARLMSDLSHNPSQEALCSAIDADIKHGTAELERIVAVSDGLSLTEDGRATARHYMNVLYNNMRGGVFLDGYTYDIALLEHFATQRNHTLAERHAGFFKTLRESGNNSITHLHEQAYANGDPDLIRICLEFLPLTFSRRHGDPSRPWNRFHIRVKDDNGNRIYHYEGNWRDIFQNWEAMCLSFPAYIEPVVAKFLNASTADGFNPYRISEDGIDWEAPQPNNPFSGYGYWGDHQIVYLSKLLEWLDAYAPEKLTRLARDAQFAYAEVPYEIKPYAELLKDGKNTITFNYDRHDRIMKRTKQYGADGKLLMDEDGVYRARFMEKLLVPVLAKLSNLVAGGGIWMNTQRPEWNDANNAIVGNGLSMVTVYQLYRHLLLCSKLAERMEGETPMSVEVKQWMDDLHTVFYYRAGKSPRVLLDEAGAAFDRYRAQVYKKGFSGKMSVPFAELAGTFKGMANVLAESIDANKREDGLYNAYNILRLTTGGLQVTPMFPMLEGQTAVLGSGRLTPEEALTLVEAMENSGLYSPEHQTFYLYPIKQLKTFTERNIIPPESAAASVLLSKLLEDGHEGFILKDADGHIRFHESIQQTADVVRQLAALANDERYATLATAEDEHIHDIYEQVFAHRQFTGRSGIMYKYEGIGSIYWHQNSKFLLSFQECFTHASENRHEGLKPLKDAYYRLRAGLGFNKEPSLWGAFPLEPYSHTPYGMPAQQPGMTGQVKEDILTRYAELGLSVKNGALHFNPALLNRAEFLQKPAIFRYINIDGEACEMPLEADTLAFTVCQVPVVYHLGTENKVTTYIKNGGSICEMRWLALSEHISRHLFERDAKVERVIVEMTEDKLV